MPKKKKVFLAHNTCLNAAYDLNVLQAGLAQGEFEIVERPELADEIIFSGCSVREHWVDDAASQIAEARNRAPGAKLTVTGCVANTSAQSLAAKLPERAITFRSMKGILQASTGQEFAAIDRRLSQNSSIKFESASSSGLQNLRLRVGAAKASVVAELQEIDRRFGSRVERQYRETTKGFVFYDETDPCEMITVTRSCPYKCSFCNIPLGRGPFESVSLEDVLAKARAARARGISHFVLIGDEVGNYGAGAGNVKLPDLIERLLALDSAVKLSIRYIEPKPFLKYVDRLLAWSMAGRIRLLYISLQSGSPKILKAMNRGYDIQRLAKTLGTFRAHTPTILYGNWMVGFPGEEDSDFLRTVSLVQELAFHINVAIPFSARPNTPAETMPNQVDPRVVSHRIERLNEVIARMKSDAMEGLLDFLDSDALASLLSRIRRAEVEQYAQEQRSMVAPSTS
ncbi:radical SAM protein [Ramlibacter sp. G-1-2-2]|uniref:Radical SAM protein n=1 Tax=Ramlibacter agri TaxID=2728837 RepID=A0A848H2U7_9BURK|nr:radical SAM protein [Ramlibacter agri]